MKKVLLVVDMQKVYERDEWHCRGIEKAEENIKLLCENFDGEIIFTRHVASENPKGTWENYNEAFSYMEKDKTNWDIVDALNPYVKTLVTKTTYSCFKSDEFKELIKTCDDTELFIVGVETEFCVLGAIFDAVDFGYKLTLISDAVASEKESLNEAVLDICSRMPSQVTLMKTKDVIKTLNRYEAKNNVKA